MQINERLQNTHTELNARDITLVAVSKGQSIERVREAYNAGQRILGENRVQELLDKYEKLPKDIEWHMIGHLQRNKVKYIAPFVAMIQSVDSMELLNTINEEARKHGRIIDCLLQIKIASEEAKYGLSFENARDVIAALQHDINEKLGSVRVCGLMGMATQTSDQEQIRVEFRSLKKFFDEIKKEYFAQDSTFSILSMGMSSDWQIAIGTGSTMIRIGRAIFQ